MPILNKLFGDLNAREIKKISSLIDRVGLLEDELAKLSDKQLAAKTKDFRSRLKDGASLDDILPEAYAVVRETGKRVLGMRHFDEQLIGGVVLHRGQIAEMRTGEGKTLVATAPVYLNALEGRGVHVVTVNDYLARRDAGWMAQIYHFLGLSTAVIMHDSSYIYDPDFTDESHSDERLAHLKPISRREAYLADVTYGTNNEFGFDYLRDNMVQDTEQIQQREYNYAIVDEVDSILIDEARTPLIISQPASKSTDRYYQFAKLARTLDPATDYVLDEKEKTVALSEEGITKIEKALGVDNVYEAGRLEDVHHIEQSLKAEAIFKRDRDYVVSPDGEIVIVDEFTGRLLPGRRYSEGLHQAIEAKENVTIQQESQTLATISFQNLFRLYPKLSGMTGTALTEAEEFAKIYKLEVTSIPTHQPMVRDDLKDRVYKTETGKFRAVIADVGERHSKGQPVLIGTVSIERNETLSNLLHKAKIPHEVLNAKNNENEAEIVARAGQRGAVTLATNIAGRGTDIVLGEGVDKLGGLHVLGTERHESRRIDNQLRGRAGRQGDPGSSQFFVSLEDDLMRIFGSERIASIMNTLGLDEDTPIENRMVTRALEGAQKKVEGHNFDIRKHLVEYDDVMNKHRESIYARRRKYLAGEGLDDEMTQMIHDVITDIVRSFEQRSDGPINLDELAEVIKPIFPLSDRWQEGLHGTSPETITAYLIEIADKAYAKRAEEFGDEAMRMMERLVCLRAIDSLWLEHLESMDHLRDAIGLRAYGQRDPLVEYKSEAYKLYSRMVERIAHDVVATIYNVSIVTEQQPVETEITELAKNIVSPSDNASNSSGGEGSGGNRAARRAAAKAAKKQR